MAGPRSQVLHMMLRMLSWLQSLRISINSFDKDKLASIELDYYTQKPLKTTDILLSHGAVISFDLYN